MQEFDINKFEKEVFEHLFQKHKTEKEAGREFYFYLTPLYPLFLKNILSGKKLYVFRNQVLTYLFRNEKLYISLLIDEKQITCLIQNAKNRIENNFSNEVIFKNHKTWKENLDDFFKKYPNILKENNNFTEEQNEIKGYFNSQFEEIKNLRKTFKGYYVSSFKIENFQGIKKAEIENIPTDTKWIFFTGKNAIGKTTVLQALAIALKGKEIHTDIFIKKKEKKQNLFNNTINEKPTNIKLTFDTGYKEFTVDFPDENDSNNIEPIVTYGANRLYVSKKTEKENSTIQLFPQGNTIALTNYELEFCTWYNKKDKYEEFEQKYNNVKKIMLKIIPNVTDIHVTKYDEVLYTEIDEDENILESLPLEKLASGMKSIIAMFGDMIVKLFNTQPYINDPAELTGIVIIDEFDLHLHPDWQRQLPGLLSDCFPKVQFIASTHSPIPLLGAPKETVILNVNRTKEAGVTVRRLEKVEKELPNLLPNVLLTSPVFGLENIKSVANKDIRDVIVDDNYNDREKHQEMEKRIDKLFETNNW